MIVLLFWDSKETTRGEYMIDGDSMRRCGSFGILLISVIVLQSAVGVCV